MTPEEYADTIIARLTMEPQGRWDADVVEFETKSADIGEVKAWIAEAIRRAVAEEKEACARLLDEAGHDCYGRCAAAIRASGETPTETTSHADLRRWGRCRRCGAEVSETHAIAGHHHAGCAIGLAWTMLHRALEGEA